MICYHLNAAQRAHISRWLLENPVRPDFRAYDRESRAIAKLTTTKKPTKVASARAGFSLGEYVPSKSFDATRHLPPGWCLVNLYDSGGNYGVGNAGDCLLRELWNCWSGHPTTTFDNGGGIYSARLMKELKANDMNPWKKTTK